MAHRREKKKARTGLGNIHFSTGNVEWSTPDDLFGELNQTFHFDLAVQRKLSSSFSVGWSDSSCQDRDLEF